MEHESIISGKSYTTFVDAIKQRIGSARISAARAVSRELIGLYWDIGKMIVEKQQELGWGKSVVETLSRDVQREFPAVTGFSPQNLWFMPQMYAEYRDVENLQQLVREIPWGHNLVIMQKIKSPV